ncbi:MAG: beta-ketoacyl-ACP synthase II [Actinomycetota bacterium]|nr:beta-ketoacyl-ACP synthase II [Actinomycetota bacterium]MDQ3574692.1 beta-ketoacyl-ACP synthase II [Actinomycetota bacterium]
MTSSEQSGRHRVAVTGLGVKSPAGNDVAEFWSTLLAARPAAAPISRFDASDLPVGFACEVHGFDPSDYFGPKEVRRADRVTHLGFAAASDALVDAGDLGADPGQCGVVVGVGIGGLWTQEEEEKVLFEKGPNRVSPFLVPMMMPNATAGTIAMRHGWKGPNLCIATACAAGTNAIGEATRLIREGSAQVVLAGGAEAVLTPIAISAFARMGALSTRSDEPERASRPFDPDRDGFVMGEGAAFLVLERWDRAEARGAEIHGEVLGYGRNADAYHITAPSPDGSGAVACMEAALRDAGIGSDDVGHVNAHGTSTPLNDAMEAEAIVKVFGGSPPPVTSTKGVTGHLIGAAGAVEAVAAILSARDELAPPTANHERTDADVTVDVVAGAPRQVSGPVVSNSFGFGGHNATLVLAAAEG